MRDSDLARERLRAFPFVNLDACFFSDSHLRIQVDLGLLGHGDGPAAKLMPFRDLDLVRSRHRLPSSHPPPPSPGEAA